MREEYKIGEKSAICIDYQKECEVLRYQLKETICELEQYKKALLNICTKI